MPILFFACSNEESDLMYNTERNHKVISINDSKLDNFLSFEDIEEFEKKILDVQDMDSTELVKWEDAHNFYSLRRISIDIELEERALLKEYEDYSIEELMKMPEKHSDMFNEFNGLFIEKQFDDSTFFYDLDIDNNNYSYLVNKDGLVEINGDIYQFKAETTKIIIGGDKSKISLLSSTNETDPINNIKVIRKDIPKANNGFTRSAYKTRHVYKVILYSDFIQSYNQSTKQYASYYKIRVRSLQKHFGLYYCNYTTHLKTETTCEGNFTEGYTLRYINGAFRYIPDYRQWTITSPMANRQKTHTLDVTYFAPYPTFYTDLGKETPKIYHAIHKVWSEKNSNISFTMSF